MRRGEYDGLSDFPSWPNPFSIANSLAASVFVLGPLTQLVGDLGGLLGELNPTDVLTGGTTYFTSPQDLLPLLQPLRLPAELLSLLSGEPVPTPIADALQPALKILVNLGYTDVEPNNGYNRSLSDAGTPTLFFTLPDLTPQQWAAVPGAVLTALVDGVQTYLSPTALKSDLGEYVVAFQALLQKVINRVTTILAAAPATPVAAARPAATSFSPPPVTTTTSAFLPNSAHVVSVSATSQQLPTAIQTLPAGHHQAAPLAHNASGHSAKLKH